MPAMISLLMCCRPYAYAWKGQITLSHHRLPPPSQQIYKLAPRGCLSLRLVFYYMILTELPRFVSSRKTRSFVSRWIGPEILEDLYHLTNSRRLYIDDCLNSNLAPHSRALDMKYLVQFIKFTIIKWKPSGSYQQRSIENTWIPSMSP